MKKIIIASVFMFSVAFPAHAMSNAVIQDARISALEAIVKELQSQIAALVSKKVSKASEVPGNRTTIDSITGGLIVTGFNPSMLKVENQIDSITVYGSDLIGSKIYFKGDSKSCSIKMLSFSGCQAAYINSWVGSGSSITFSIPSNVKADSISDSSGNVSYFYSFAIVKDGSVTLVSIPAK